MEKRKKIRSSILIDGEKLRKIRMDRALTQEEIGRQIGLTGSRVAQLEKSQSVGIFPSVLRGLSEVTGEPIERLLLKLSATMVTDAGADSVDPKRIQPVHDIPTFDLAVAAGPWTDVAQVGQLQDPSQILDGRFRIRLQGNSMEPAYPDRSLVEFRSLRFGVDPCEVGKDYYVQVDNNATFKRLTKFGEIYVFRAVNREVYPKPFSVPKSEIIRMAKAEYVLTVAGK